MAVIIIPSHKNWTDLKKLHDVADGAVSGINIGKALDTYHASVKAGARFALPNAEACGKLETVLSTYIGKLDKKKVKKDYAKFEKAFLDNYVGAAHAKKEDFKRYQADADTYRKEIASFFTMVQRMPPQKTTLEDLQKFRSGPLRGLSAVGSGLRDRDIDLTAINKTAGEIQGVIDGLGKNGDPEKARLDIIALAERMSTEAKHAGVA